MCPSYLQNHRTILDLDFDLLLDLHLPSPGTLHICLPLSLVNKTLACPLICFEGSDDTSLSLDLTAEITSSKVKDSLPYLSVCLS
ncbi:unnamed protein product [Cochlearia groenlandica]